METPNRPGYARSAQMAAALRQAFLYSEKRARDCVFYATEISLANSNSAPTLISLIRLALHAARDRAEVIQYDLANSEIVTRAVFHAMLRAGVLLDLNGKPILVGLRSYATRVSALTPAFRDETEAFLLEFLIGALGNVGPRDHLPLAHVLFRQFDSSVPMSDLEDRLAALLDRLGGRIELSGGAYAVRSPALHMTAAGST